ncbi:MAG: Hpt domain-containing protein [Alphaproteobacteria bacterium]|nr:Hpt domain-containing protein [Alphaproteobacteria bacterium]
MMEAKTMMPGLERIRTRFLDMLSERLTEIDRLCDPSVSGLSPRDALTQVQMILHKIAGTAGTLGMNDLGDKARAGENVIIDFLGSGGAAKHQVYRTVASFIIHAEQTLDGARA